MASHSTHRPALDTSRLSLPDRWRLEVLEESESTNAELIARHQGGEAPGLVLVAEHQTAGRGRLGRQWLTPPRSALTVSVLVAPGLPLEQWGWLPLLTGLSVVDAVRDAAGIDVGLKWPNDVLVEDRKLAGILVEVAASAEQISAAVIGVGINHDQQREELPPPGPTGLVATSLLLEEGVAADRVGVDRTELLAALLQALDRRLEAWAGSGVAPVVDYRAACRTLGRRVRVLLPGDDEVVGTAVEVDGRGRLVVETQGGQRSLDAGDVVHVREPEAEREAGDQPG